MPFLEQYALSVRREPIPVLESVAHMVEFMTMPGVKVKKTETESIPLGSSRYLYSAYMVEALAHLYLQNQYRYMAGD